MGLTGLLRIFASPSLTCPDIRTGAMSLLSALLSQNAVGMVRYVQEARSVLKLISSLVVPEWPRDCPPPSEASGVSCSSGGAPTVATACDTLALVAQLLRMAASFAERPPGMDGGAGGGVGQ